MKVKSIALMSAVVVCAVGEAQGAPIQCPEGTERTGWTQDVVTEPAQIRNSDTRRRWIINGIIYGSLNRCKPSTARMERTVSHNETVTVGVAATVGGSARLEADKLFAELAIETHASVTSSGGFSASHTESTGFSLTNELDPCERTKGYLYINITEADGNFYYVSDRIVCSYPNGNVALRWSSGERRVEGVGEGWDLSGAIYFDDHDRNPDCCDKPSGDDHCGDAEVVGSARPVGLGGGGPITPVSPRRPAQHWHSRDEVDCVRWREIDGNENECGRC